MAKHNSTLEFQIEYLIAIRNSILNEIKEANYYAIMFDCTAHVSHTEQKSQIICYVTTTIDVCEIKECFIDFIEVAGKPGKNTC